MDLLSADDLISCQIFYSHFLRSFLRTFFAHVKFCQVRADTNLAIEKFYFSIFSPLLYQIFVSHGKHHQSKLGQMKLFHDNRVHLSVEALHSVRFRKFCIPGFVMPMLMLFPSAPVHTLILNDAFSSPETFS